MADHEASIASFLGYPDSTASAGQPQAVGRSGSRNESDIVHLDHPPPAKAQLSGHRERILHHTTNGPE
jgi:hypothetical protein